jgi:hypothetical protein
LNALDSEKPRFSERVIHHVGSRIMITRWQHFRASFFAAAGTILAIMASFILVAVWLPVINPGFFRVQTGETSCPTGFYVIGSILCIGLIVLGKVGSDRSLRTVNQYKEQNKNDGPNQQVEGIRR